MPFCYMSLISLVFTLLGVQAQCQSKTAKRAAIHAFKCTMTRHVI